MPGPADPLHVVVLADTHLRGDHTALPPAVQDELARAESDPGSRRSTPCLSCGSRSTIHGARRGTDVTRPRDVRLVRSVAGGEGALEG